jgi:hypothetical protein
MLTCVPLGVRPAQAGIQDAEAYRRDTDCGWNTGPSACADDDSCGCRNQHLRQPTVRSGYSPISCSHLGQHLHAVLLRVLQLRARTGTGDDIVRPLRHRARDFRAEPLGSRLGLIARHLFQRAGEHHRLGHNRRMALRLLRVEDLHLVRQPLDDAAVVVLAEIGGDALDHGVADLIERIHLGDRLLVPAGHLETGVVEGLP